MLQHRRLQYLWCSLVYTLLTCACSTVGMLVIYLKKSQLEDLLIFSASFLKPLSANHRSIVKFIPRLYFSIQLAWILVDVFMFLFTICWASTTDRDGHWQWHYIWTLPWLSSPMNSSSWTEWFDKQLNETNWNGINPELDPPNNSSLFSAEIDLNANWRCCSSNQRFIPLDIEWITLLCIDLVLRSYLHFTLLCIKTLYLSISLLFVFKCGQLSREVKRNHCHDQQLNKARKQEALQYHQNRSKLTSKLETKPSLSESNSKSLKSLKYWRTAKMKHLVLETFKIKQLKITHHHNNEIKLVRHNAERKRQAQPSRSAMNAIRRESERLSSLIQVLLDNIRRYDSIFMYLSLLVMVINLFNSVGLWEFRQCLVQQRELTTQMSTQPLKLPVISNEFESTTTIEDTGPSIFMDESTTELPFHSNSIGTGQSTTTESKLVLSGSPVKGRANLDSAFTSSLQTFRSKLIQFEFAFIQTLFVLNLVDCFLLAIIFLTIRFYRYRLLAC